MRIPVMNDLSCSKESQVQYSVEARQAANLAATQKGARRATEKYNRNTSTKGGRKIHDTWCKSAPDVDE